MLKIKDNSKFYEEVIDKYELEYDADSDYESGWSYAIYMKEGVVFDVGNCSEDGEQGTIYIKGLEGTKLDILYDLIKANLIEKVENEKDKNNFQG